MDDEPNVVVIPTEDEATSARFKAWKSFMARLAPTPFTVKPEFQEKWWGYCNDTSHYVQ